MDDATAMTLLQQHIELLKQMALLQQEINTLWIAFIILIFVQLFFILCIVALAAWSVTTVVRAGDQRSQQLENQWAEHKEDMKQSIGLIVRTLRNPNADTGS